MPNRRPKMKSRPAGEGKPGVPYRPIYPPLPEEEGPWYWSYERKAWVKSDPYPKDGKRG